MQNWSESELIANGVLEELSRATGKYGPMNSAHEAYAVILEELDEFWNEVKKKEPDLEKMRKELVQVAAMAMRAIHDIA